jgi:hypothetical protein
MQSNTITPGYCECGCGTYVGKWKNTSRANGQIKGEFKRFVRGHARRRPAAERLWEKVVKTEAGCWIWLGHENGHGYGRITVDGKQLLTHRFAYELLRGPIPDGLQIDHLCRNRRCLNPDHLEPVTNRENKMRSPQVGTETHCKHGHEFTHENTYTHGKSGRSCRACHRDRERVRRLGKAKL